MIFRFIVLLSSLAHVADLTKCLFLNDVLCMVIPTIIDMNPVELKYYTCNSKQIWNNKTCQCKCKNYRKCQENYSWNRSKCISENSKSLRSDADTSVTECDEVIIVMDNLSTKNRNTIATNVTSTASTNWHSRKIRGCYILHTVFLLIILILIIVICYQYPKQKVEKWKIMDFKKFLLKIVRVIISMT